MLALAIAAAVSFDHPWGRFSRAPVLAHTAEVVEIETRGVREGQLFFVLRLTRTSLRTREVKWTDSLRCPALRRTLASLHDLAPPRIAPPGSHDDATNIVLDGTGYSLSMPAAYGADEATIAMSSISGTPLARWVDGALTALAPCWSAEPPNS